MLFLFAIDSFDIGRSQQSRWVRLQPHKNVPMTKDESGTKYIWHEMQHKTYYKPKSQTNENFSGFVAIQLRKHAIYSLVALQGWLQLIRSNRFIQIILDQYGPYTIYLWIK